MVKIFTQHFEHYCLLWKVFWAFWRWFESPIKKFKYFYICSTLAEVCFKYSALRLKFSAHHFDESKCITRQRSTESLPRWVKNFQQPLARQQNISTGSSCLILIFLLDGFWNTISIPVIVRNKVSHCTVFGNISILSLY